MNLKLIIFKKTNITLPVELHPLELQLIFIIK